MFSNTIISTSISFTAFWNWLCVDWSLNLLSREEVLVTYLLRGVCYWVHRKEIEMEVMMMMLLVRGEDDNNEMQETYICLMILECNEVSWSEVKWYDTMSSSSPFPFPSPPSCPSAFKPFFLLVLLQLQLQLHLSFIPLSSRWDRWLPFTTLLVLYFKLV